MAPIDALERPTPTHISNFVAAELSGELNVQPALADYTLEELEEVASSMVESATTAHFMLADILLEVINRGGEKATERAERLREFCGKIRLDERAAREHIRIGRAYPPEERAKYPQLSWGHFREIATRSAKTGEDKTKRQERIKELTERVADEDLGVNATKRLIEETVRPERPSPHAALVDVLLEGLQKTLEGDAPGTWALIVESVEGHLLGRSTAVSEQFWITQK
jgi:hypothetical protein